MPHVLRIQVRGPLAMYAEGFATELSETGYTVGSTEQLVRLMARMSEWLEDQGLDAGGLSPAEAARFAAHRRAAGITRHRSARALRPMLLYLGKLDVLPPPCVKSASTPVEETLEYFQQYLTVERGLGDTVIKGYVWAVRPFLLERTRHDGLHLSDITAGDVAAFVVARCSGRSRSAAKMTVTGLRSLLRFLHVIGTLPRSLENAVPSAAGWRLAPLPRALDPDVIRRMLGACDKASVQGLRDFAILTLLTRMGLRAGEVAALTLDNFDWRIGEVVIRGKGRQDERMPLPGDVGEAIIDYLQRGRPLSAVGRSLFVRVKAPHGPLMGGSICEVVASVCRRAGLPVVRAHRLRHTVATELVRAGAPLIEVGQLLRHRRIETTAIYAKVDREALRVLAPPWPETWLSGGTA